MLHACSWRIEVVTVGGLGENPWRDVGIGRCSVRTVDRGPNDTVLRRTVSRILGV